MKLYVLDYYLSGRNVETIFNNKPVNKSIAVWKRNRLEKTTHKLGKLILRSI